MIVKKIWFHHHILFIHADTVYNSRVNGHVAEEIGTLQ